MADNVGRLINADLDVEITAAADTPGSSIITTLPAPRPIGVSTNQKTIPSGQKVNYRTKGLYEFPVASADDVSVGDALYFDVADGELNKTASGNIFAGFAHTAAGVGVTLVQLMINEGVTAAA